MVDNIVFFLKPCYNWQPSYCLGLDMTSFFFQKMKKKIQNHEFFIFIFLENKIYIYIQVKRIHKRKKKKKWL
jgi:hypothetical protein